MEGLLPEVTPKGWIKEYLDYADFRWEEGKAEGLAEGEAKGMEMGKTAAQLEMAKKFKVAGIPVTTIAECSGLSIDEVERM